MKYCNKYVFCIFFTSTIFQNSVAMYICPYTCNTDPLEQIYPNQNMCELLGQIPLELRNLPYVMYPNCDVYNTDRFGYNKRFNIFPHAIIVPETQDQVVYVLSVLKKYKLFFSVRSGGHCYGPGSLSNGYIIDLRNFNSIIPDIAKQEVFIGAGCRLGQVIETLGALDYAIPTGTCPSVGISGLALGGGIGFLARKYGLTADSIKSMTTLMADGSIIEVTQQDYPDLFWGLAGAGANSFGIVLGFTFKMYYIPLVSFAELKWDWDPKRNFAIFEQWQKWITTLPDSISTEINFKYNQGVIEVALSIFKADGELLTEWQESFEKFNPKVVTYRGNYLGAAAFFASTYTLPFSKVKTKFLFKPLSCKGIEAMIDFFNHLEKHPCNIILFLEFGSAFGGAISQGDTSYFPRKAFEYLFQFVYWPYEFQATLAIHLINEIYHKLEPYTSPFSYANLIDYELGARYLHAYYGDHVDRLISIKNTYDPENIFRWRQGIPLSNPPKSCLAKSIEQRRCRICLPR